VRTAVLNDAGTAPARNVVLHKAIRNSRTCSQTKTAYLGRHKLTSYHHHWWQSNDENWISVFLWWDNLFSRTAYILIKFILYLYLYYIYIDKVINIITGIVNFVINLWQKYELESKFCCSIERRIYISGIPWITNYCQTRITVKRDAEQRLQTLWEKTGFTPYDLIFDVLATISWRRL